MPIGLLFVFIFLTGFWLMRMGRPVRTIPLTLHKLIGLGTAVYIGWNIQQSGKLAGIGGQVLSATVLTGSLFLVMILSGGWLSLEKPAPVAISWVHKLVSLLTVLSTVWLMVLLSGGV